MKVNPRGQVTIPKEIRQKLGLVPHCEVKFEIVGDSVRMQKARKAKSMTRGEMIVAHLRASGTKRYRSTDELMKLLRGDD
jgi:AbrB family looped-hinge helix DNA binding protein